MAMTAIEQHMLDLGDNTDEMLGPDSWLDAYVGLAEMQNSAAGLTSRAEADRLALVYSIRAASDAGARRTEAEVTNEEWKAARHKEYTSLKDRGVFELATSIPTGTRIIDVKEVRSVRPDGHFQEIGLIQCNTDRSVHYLKDASGKIKLVLAAVVDDILATGEKETFDAVIAELAEAGIDFDQPSIGLAKSFNGMRIEQPEPHLIELDQEQYINELRETYQQSYPDWEHVDTATLPTTARYETHLTDAMAAPRKKDAEKDAMLSQNPRMRANFVKSYQHLLGALLWPSRITRPDLAYVTGIAGQCAHEPKTSHLLALEHLLSYAVNTKGKKIVIDCRANPRRTSLSLFTDADHAGCHDTRKSRSGVVVFMNGAPISWQSKK